MSSETRYPEIDFTPPVAVARQAQHGLELRNAHGRGGTMVGVARARELKNRRPVGPSTVKRMHSYFARHEVDKHAAHFADEEKPSAGYIAWLLWGGDPGRKWADDLARAMEAADDKRVLRRARRHKAH
jgi:hypothetical protein